MFLPREFCLIKLERIIYSRKFFISIIFKFSMAQQQGMQMPGVFGGLMRYDEEFNSRFMLSPGQVIAFIVFIVALVIILKTFFPVVA